METGRTDRSDSVSRPYTYAGNDTAETQRIEFHGVSERQEQLDDIRPAREPKIQIWQQRILVPWVLCRYGGQKYKCDSGIYTKPVTRGFILRTDDDKGVS